MRKIFGGAVALGLATAGSLAGAGPGFAQEGPEELVHLEANLTPKEVAHDGTVTVTSVDSCSASGEGAELEWAVFHEGDFSWDDPNEDAEPVLIDFADLNEDGSWEVTFKPSDFGTVDPAKASDMVAATKAEDPGEDPEDPTAIEVYGPIGFSVEGVDEQPDEGFEFVALCFDFGEEPDALVDEITSHELDEDFGVYPTKAGDDVTAASVDPCPQDEEGTATGHWFLFSDQDDVLAEGDLSLAADGSWQQHFKAPAERGFYFFSAACADASSEFTGFYDDLVISNDVTGPPPVRPPTPATPIVEPPHETG